MKLKWLFHLVVFSILFYVSAAWSANYYFSKDRKVDGYYYSDVYELNLETGNVRIIFPADNKILYPFVLSDQSKIFFRCNWKLCVYDTEQGIIDTISHLGNIERIDNVHFIPSINEVYLDFIGEHASVDKELQMLDNTLISIDKNSYTFIDTISTFGIVNSLLSKDGEKIFILQDSLSGIFFEGSNFRSGPFTYDIFVLKNYENLNLKIAPKFYDKANGFALVRYVSNDSAHYVVCDPENKTSICDLTLPWKSCPYFDAYLSPNGDIVLDNVGNIYIYDGRTAKLKQRAKFTPPADNNDDPIVLFLNNKLYYLPEDPAKSEATSFDNIQTTDMNIIQPKSDLLSVLIDDLESCWNKGWIDNDGVYNSLKVKLHAAFEYFKIDQTETAKNNLNAFMNELNAQKDKHINDRAWRVLSVNVFQLI